MNEFASHVLESVRERVVEANVSKEGGADEGVNHSTEGPLVDEGEEEAEHKPIEYRSDHILRLHSLLLEFVDVLSKLYFIRRYLRKYAYYYQCKG